MSRDAADGDGGCQCLAADSGWEIATTSLDCFLDGAAFAAYDFAVYAVDPCIGLHGSRSGYRSEQTYSAHNLIGVYTGGGDGPRYEYFYDATMKALVGATRISWWTGDDPLNCNGATGHYVTVRAGIFPDCDGGTCTATNSRPLCSPGDSGID